MFEGKILLVDDQPVAAQDSIAALEHFAKPSQILFAGDAKAARQILDTEPVRLAFLDIEMPDVNGVKKKLSEVDAKVVVLHFWAPSQPVQKMYNIEVLKPLYEKYSDKGLEIYQVAIDTDKAGWARIVKEQNLDWINVCDGLGEASPAVVSYNLSVLPATFILSGGTLQKDRISDDSSLRAAVSRLLK